MLEFLTNLALDFSTVWHFYFPSTFLFGEHDFPKCED